MKRVVTVATLLAGCASAVDDTRATDYACHVDLESVTRSG